MAATKLAFTVNQASDAIGVSRRTVYKLISEKRLDVRKVGRRTLVTAESLHRLIEIEPA